MARKENLSNLKTEKEGIIVLRELMDGFMVPTKEQRQFLYKLCGIDYRKYSRSVDGIQLLVSDFNKIKSEMDFLLIEVKTTKAKNVKTLPYGAFFGFTQNEEDLFKSKDNYRLCIVHTGLKEYYSMGYEEYLSLIQNKRVQYQINFRSEQLDVEDLPEL